LEVINLLPEAVFHAAYSEQAIIEAIESESPLNFGRLHPLVLIFHSIIAIVTIFVAAASIPNCSTSWLTTFSRTMNSSKNRELY